MSAADLTNPQSMNLYAYVENNPVDFVDPSGLFKLALKEREFDWSGWWRFLMDSYEHSRPPSGGGGGGVHEPSGGGAVENSEPGKENDINKCKWFAMNAQMAADHVASMSGLSGKEKAYKFGKIMANWYWRSLG